MATVAEIIPDRLAKLLTISLARGAHSRFSQGACAMEAASWIAGEPWSDHPACVSPVIAAFMRSWNDGLPQEDRDRLLLPLIQKTINTHGTAEMETRRAYMATDWMIRVHAPAWLRLAGLTKQADTLAGFPEITGMASIPPIRPALEAVRDDADAAGAAAWAAAGAAAWAAAGVAARAAAWAAARAAARDAAWDAALDAARDAARDAAGAAAWAAAWDAARAAARAAAGAAAWAAAGAAAWAAAWDAAWAKLNPTKAELQQSAVNLVERMCALVD